MTMRRVIRAVLLIASASLAAGQLCVPAAPPVATRLAFTNLSIRFYAALAIRPHTDAAGGWVTTPLLAPGADYRADFASLLGNACPGSLDLRIYLYRRVNEGVPIGLDATEAVEPAPVVAGEVLGLPACDTALVEDYTVVNWESPESTARVKITQGTEIENQIRAMNLFPNIDAAWELAGVDLRLLPAAPPAQASKEAIRGQVTLADGTGVQDIGVLLRSRFRVRLGDVDTGADPDVGWSELPIALTKTDGTGGFQIDRPAGVYRVEVLADGYLFRPPWVDVETPLQQITIVAEPQP